jgi:hypothetical protein
MTDHTFLRRACGLAFLTIFLASAVSPALAEGTQPPKKDDTQHFSIGNMGQQDLTPAQIARRKARQAERKKARAERHKKEAEERAAKKAAKAAATPPPAAGQ